MPAIKYKQRICIATVPYTWAHFWIDISLYIYLQKMLLSWPLGNILKVEGTSLTYTGSSFMKLLLESSLECVTYNTYFRCEAITYFILRFSYFLGLSCHIHITFRWWGSWNRERNLNDKKKWLPKANMFDECCIPDSEVFLAKKISVDN